jgi:hypothetical protein
MKITETRLHRRAYGPGGAEFLLYQVEIWGEERLQSVAGADDKARAREIGERVLIGLGAAPYQELQDLSRVCLRAGRPSPH